ncbi:hypothetical protein ACFY2H_10945 [Streptomyces griseofuscus]|uniref:hypothetical protein n=1 Tax=Streptomyces griseofuscus TaxID=146922 RepID=UPI0036C7D3C8
MGHEEQPAAGLFGIGTLGGDGAALGEAFAPGVGGLDADGPGEGREVETEVEVPAGYAAVPYRMPHSSSRTAASLRARRAPRGVEVKRIWKVVSWGVPVVLAGFVVTLITVPPVA